MYRSIKRLFKRLRKQQVNNKKYSLSDHRTVDTALRMVRYMAHQDMRLTGAPLARAE